MRLAILKPIGVVVVALAAAALVGCAPSAQPSGAASPQTTFSGKVPDFHGPWAAELAHAYSSTNSDVVHKILDKGSISDQDYAAVSSAYVKCMANKGFTVKITGPNGEADVKGNGDAIAAEKSCSGDMSIIASLRYEMSRNPQHLDENTIVAACLVKKGLASASYTAKEYGADLQSQKFPFDSSSTEFVKCTSDPLGLASE
jgi:hypothetical protein